MRMSNHPNESRRVWVYVSIPLLSLTLSNGLVPGSFAFWWICHRSLGFRVALCAGKPFKISFIQKIDEVCGRRVCLWDKYGSTLKKKKTTFKKTVDSHLPVYPPKGEMFSAFEYSPLKSVRVVILGQDPYISPNQAHGLCFSVKPGNAVPPSLRNMYKYEHFLPWML